VTTTAAGQARPDQSRRAARAVVTTAMTGTVSIATGAFWLSFDALSDLAHRAGIAADRAWVWPLIVDGMIVVATVSVVALAADRRAARYPWLLLAAAAAVSVAANVSHALLAAAPTVPAVVAAAVAAVPPVVLLAVTHLTVALTRTPKAGQPAGGPPSARPTRPHTANRAVPARRRVAQPPAEVKADALRLRAETTSTNRAIAAQLGVHPSTVGRWLTAHPPAIAAVAVGEDAVGEIAEEDRTGE
jgi:hypothetical protein